MAAARSTSASSQTITGEGPPSSIVMRFMWLPASAAICLPTGTEAVNETLRTMGEAMRDSDTPLGTPPTTWSTPGGRPASWNRRAMVPTALGESSGPLMMIVQPAATAAAILRMAWLYGKFQGVNAAHTPIGSRRTHPPHPGRGGRGGGNEAAVNGAPLLRMPVAVVGAAHHLAHGLGQRFALVERDVAADLLGAGTTEFSNLAQDGAALHRRHGAPALEGALRGGKCAVEVGAAGVRQAAEPLTRGRVEHVLLDAAVALEKLAVDVKGKRFVHECLRRGTRIYLFARTCTSASSSARESPPNSSSICWRSEINGGHSATQWAMVRTITPYSMVRFWIHAPMPAVGSKGLRAALSAVISTAAIRPTPRTCPTSGWSANASSFSRKYGATSRTWPTMARSR